jgi:hypothetical protein
LQRIGAAQANRASELVEPPRTLRTRRGVFEGDAAAVELRSRFARIRDETLLPAERRSADRWFGGALRSVGVLVLAAAAAGAAGYLLGGFGLPQINPAPAASPPAPGDAGLLPAPAVPAANFKPAGRASQLPAPQTAAIDLVPADVRRGAGSGEAALPPGSQTAVPPPASVPSVPAQDPAEIAAKMKLGADLMASGDIASARRMFERVAEAGEAAGAFTLAETYDPIVLKALRLRGGGIAANPMLARHWYEQARDMGSAAATDRIARLTQGPR